MHYFIGFINNKKYYKNKLFSSQLLNYAKNYLFFEIKI